MNKLRIEFRRHFQIWLYSVSHRQLLLRSNRSDEHSTRVDVLFKNVAELKMPTSFTGLSIEEASNESFIGISTKSITEALNDKKVFVIHGDDFSGYVVAAGAFWHEDEGFHFDKSHFSDSFASLEV